MNRPASAWNNDANNNNNNLTGHLLARLSSIILRTRVFQLIPITSAAPAVPKWAPTALYLRAPMARRRRPITTNEKNKNEPHNESQAAALRNRNEAGKHSAALSWRWPAKNALMHSRAVDVMPIELIKGSSGQIHIKQLAIGISAKWVHVV